MYTTNSAQQYTIQTVSGQITVSESDLQFSYSILTGIYRFFILSPLRFLVFTVPLLLILGAPAPANVSIVDRIIFIISIIGIGLLVGAIVMIIAKVINHLSPNRPTVSTDNSAPLESIREVQLINRNMFFDITVIFEINGEQKQIVRRFASKKQYMMQEDEIISSFKLHGIDVRLV